MEHSSCAAAITHHFEVYNSIFQTLPLLVIEQAALQWLCGQGDSPAPEEVLDKLVVRTMVGIVNAGRNAV